ncbi:GFA family protein [Seohaeicola zhoushanensis]
MDAEAETVTVRGPVKTYRSSPFAERAWCDTCGSNLWIRDDGKQYELMPGLFPNAGGARLTHVVYADRAPEGWNYAGEITRISATDYEKANPFVSEGDMP